MSDLEERIDPQEEEHLLQQWKAFCDGRLGGKLFSPARGRKFPSRVKWPEIAINESLKDMHKMALHQFARCSRILEEGSGELLCVRANYGTGILPSLFGAELFLMEDRLNTLPSARPLAEGTAAVKRCIDRGVPDLNSSLGARVFEMAGFFLEIRKTYPKIGRFVAIYHPDLQGPMDACELLWGSGLFLDVLDQPGLVKEFLALITDSYIAFMDRWNTLISPENEYAVHWSMLHRGRVMLREDSAVNFSPEMFREFIEPHDRRIFGRLGGGAVHFCGKGDHFIDILSGIEGLYAVHISQPRLNDLEKIFRHTVDKNIKLIGLQRIAAEKAISEGWDLRGQVHCWDRQSIN